MGKIDNQPHYHHLRDKYPVFVYESCSFVKGSDILELNFIFSVNDKYFFKPQISIPVKGVLNDNLSNELLHSMAFNIGMVEMISYWKAFCSPCIIIKPYALNPGQQQWWIKLFRHGLGEFFYTNGIEIPGSEMLSFSFPNHIPFLEKTDPPFFEDRVLIPVGGGKDSVVTLELLKQYSANNLAVVVNHREATRQVIDVAGFDNNRVVEVKRSIDPLLLKLNQQGFLNGHTPFSALLAFITSLCACLNATRYVALSNESSANEATIPGTIINHQYSKSIEFEQDFREYFSGSIFEGLEYFSFLRPLNELQIGLLFSRLKQYHGVFKSCNAGSKTDTWCGKCPKCLFTYIILSPFIKPAILKDIFGNDLFENSRLIPLLDQLTGASDNKPFECVGTIDEVNMAIVSSIKQRERKDDMPALLDYYSKGQLFAKYSDEDFLTRLNGFHLPHFLDKPFEEILQNALKNNDE